MAEVDTSSYNLLKPTQSPLEIAGGFAGLMRSINANKLFQAQKATGQATLDAADPTSGQVNQNLLLQNLKARPDAAIAAPDAIQQGQTIQTSQIQNQQQQLNLHLAHLANMRTVIAPLLLEADGRTDPTQLRQKILKSIVTLAGNKSLTPQEAATVASDLPYDAPGVKSWLTEHLTKNLSATDQITTMLGGVGRQPTVNLQTGAPESTVVATPGVIPVGSLAPAGGGQASAAPPAGTIQTGPSTGTLPTLEESANQYTAARTDNADAVNRMNTITKGFDALDKVKYVGPLSKDWNETKKMLQNIPIIGDAVQGTTSFDKLEKFLAQNVSAQPQAVNGTDAKLVQATISNPHLGQTKEAIQYLLAGNMAFERMKAAQFSLFKGQPQEFANWRANFNRGIDPRAFAYDLYTPDQRKEILSGLSKEGQQKFLNTVNQAIAAGVLDKSIFGK